VSYDELSKKENCKVTIYFIVNAMQLSNL
jgi:hypothetical protein